MTFCGRSAAIPSSFTISTEPFQLVFPQRSLIRRTAVHFATHDFLSLHGLRRFSICFARRRCGSLSDESGAAHFLRSAQGIRAITLWTGAIAVVPGSSDPETFDLLPAFRESYLFADHSGCVLFPQANFPAEISWDVSVYRLHRNRSSRMTYEKALRFFHRVP
jgi:hypothetical protein